MSSLQVQSATGATHQVNFLFKPVGCKENTTSGIKKWLKEEEPGFVKKLNPLTLGGAISLLLGALIGLFTKSDTNKGGGFLGGILAIGGIVAGIIGFLGGPNLNTEETTIEKPKDTVLENKPLSRDEDQKPSPGKSVTSGNEINKEVKVADTRGKVTDNQTVEGKPVAKEEDEIKKLINLVIDKSANVELRKGAIEKLEKSEDKRIVTPLINCLKRKKEHPCIRGYVAWALSSRKNPKEIERIQKALIQILTDKKDINKVGNEYLKQRVIVALAKIVNKDALGILKTMQGDPLETQIAYVKFAIEKIEKRHAESTT